MRTRYLFLILALSLGISSLAQERLVPLSGNPVLRAWRALHPTPALKSGGVTYLSLPFLDDFSETSGIYPNPARWADRDAFINTSYAFRPPTLGVATLDVLDDTGAVHAGATFSAFPADELSSHFIRLDSSFAGTPRALGPADSLYLSFWYQPEGLGNAPDAGDLLELQFLEAWHVDTIVDSINPPYDTLFIDVWNTVWSSDGMGLEAFAQQKGDYFAQVMLPILDTVYFRKDFKFRFINYGSLADNTLPSWQSNVDHWNIDYVYLDANRRADEPFVPDITLVDPAYSLLKTYDVMPWAQYSANPSRHMGDSLELLISNLGDETVISTFEYNITDQGGSVLHQFEGGNYNLDPYYQSGYQTFAQHADPPVAFSYPGGTGDSTEFTTTLALGSIGLGSNVLQGNDTSRYVQRFRNFYAHDDGSAEAGYGLTPAGAQLAYRFILDVPDTLTEVRFFFNRTSGSDNQQYFTLAIWDNQVYRPGKVLWKKEGLLPQFGEGINGFVSYLIDSESPLVLQDTFYVGWVQTTDDNLNVGFDRHRDARREIFFNVSNDLWFNSDFHGALMIRPVFGQRQPGNKGDEGSMASPLRIFPNPVEGRTLQLSLREGYEDIANDARIEIYDISGRRWMDTGWHDNIEFPAGMAPGMYFLRLRSYSLDSAISLRFILP
ncbi:MAG TPA: T9SS type A sorting domain-containing protein [Bacteroidales bacterium]|nr:T9SS type A sorting domain-containing protein [Bacteroidales bacterium]